MSTWGNSSHCAPRPHFLVLVSNARETVSVTGHPVPVPQRCHRGIRFSPPKAGLPLQQELASGSALVTDQNTGKVLYSRNPDLVVPIARSPSLMRPAMVVLDSKLPLDEYCRSPSARPAKCAGCFPGCGSVARISRRDMLLLALMSSENRAAASLAQNYPGGKNAFVKAMNGGLAALEWKNTRYVEPTGLSLHNVSTARDLTRLLVASRQYLLLSQWSTTPRRPWPSATPTYTWPQHQSPDQQQDLEHPVDQDLPSPTEAAHVGDGHHDQPHPVNLVVLDACSTPTSPTPPLGTPAGNGQVTAIPGRGPRPIACNATASAASPGWWPQGRYADPSCEDRARSEIHLAAPGPSTAPRRPCRPAWRFCEWRAGGFGRAARLSAPGHAADQPARRSRHPRGFCPGPALAGLDHHFTAFVVGDVAGSSGGQQTLP